MNERNYESTVTQRLAERPSVSLSEIAHVRPRDLGIRFVAGALTSIAAGVLSIVFTARVAGLMLAFPAILAASLTLIEEQDDSVEAREDARGAILGGAAMGAFAAVAAITFGSMSGAIALVLGSAAWAGVALGGYLIAWWR
jgi:hypothetical protein